MRQFWMWRSRSSRLPQRSRLLAKEQTRYFVPSKDMDFLFNHPQPNSLIVDAVHHKNKASQFRILLPNKDTKKLDLFGRKIYSPSTLMLRIANYAALLSNHNFDNYAKLPELMQHLPETKRPLLKAIVQEGYSACRTSLQIALDVTDTAIWAMATGIATRRASWLMAAGAPKELQNKVEDLPFVRKKLFATSTDNVLHSDKDSRTTLRTLGMYLPSSPLSVGATIHSKGDMTIHSRNVSSVLLTNLDSDSVRSASASSPIMRQPGRTPNSKFNSCVEDKNTSSVLTVEEPTTTLLFHHRIKPYYHQWRDITSDHWVLEVINSGLTIPFVSIPPTTPPTPSLFRDPSHKTQLQQEILGCT
nr:uncharacterized protein LOC112547038 [Pelodiscus sinensis]|eukprot:XP_025044280.1 uncharacterized protein LOC112547038 [Pelodiscus sinensis]